MRMFILAMIETGSDPIDAYNIVMERMVRS